MFPTNRIFSAVAGLSFCVQPLEAQEEVMSPIVVTATLAEEALLDVPYSVNRVDAKRVDELMAASFPEALVNIPGVMLQQTSHGQGSPFIRGFTGFRNLALIDGIRLNNSVFRDGPNQYWSTIDALSLESIEVVKGQGSVLFGSDAIGGVVNARTKGPVYRRPEVPAPAKGGKGAKSVLPITPVPAGQYVTGGLSTRYSTAENSWMGRIEGSLSEWENYGLYVGVTGRTFGDIEAADLGTLPNTGYDEFGVDVKLEYFLDSDTKLTVAHNQFHQNDVWRTHRTVYAVPFAGSTVGEELEHFFDQDRYLTWVRLEGEVHDSWLDHYQITVSHHLQSEDRFRRRSGGRSDQEGFDVTSWGVAVDLRSESPIGTLSYGASYYYDDVSSYRLSRSNGSTTRAIQGPVGDGSAYHLVAGYLQDSIQLSDRVELLLGGRYTHAEADVGRAEDPSTGGVISRNESWDDLSGSARVQWTVDAERQWRIFAGASQAFRAPNLSDMSRFDVARSDEIEVPAAELDPEKFLNSEVGVSWQGDRASVSLAYFYTDIQDMIVRTPTGRIVDGSREVTRANGGDGYVQGVELGLDWKIAKQWTLFGNLTWQDGEVEGFPTSRRFLEEEAISRLMPLTGLAGLRWDSESGRWWVEGTVQMVDDATRLSSGDRGDTQRIPPGGTPGYTVATVRAGCRVTEALTVTAAVANLTDEAYRIHGSGVNEPGVNFIFGAKLTF